MRYFVFLFFYVYSFSAFSLQESEISTAYDLLEKKSLYQMGDFKGEKDLNLRYLKFGKRQGEKGSLIFVNGRAENIFKYIELYYDFYLKGWSPIYTYDHRGQGFSDRILSDSNIGYIDNYSYYREDLKAFLSIVKKDPEVDKKNLFLISHSMGGTIAVDYLQNYKNPIFKALILSSPLFYIKMDKSSIRSYLFAFYCFLFSCLERDKVKNKMDMLTDSKARRDFFAYLQKEKFPQAALGPASFRWLFESTKTGYKLMKKNNIKKIKIPVLILQGEKDFVISNDHHNKFCERIPECCRLKKLHGKHEHFFEKDEIRSKAIQEVLEFFSKYKKHKELCSKTDPI